MRATSMLIPPFVKRVPEIRTLLARVGAAGSSQAARYQP
jgi:hypothetical protein